MKFFDPRKKAILWISISFIFLILFVNSDDEFFKGNIFENLVALFGACLISGFAGFIVLFFVNVNFELPVHFFNRRHYIFPFYDATVTPTLLFLSKSVLGAMNL
jgi:hypothetical protein